jgi:hypothetical protein
MKFEENVDELISRDILKAVDAEESFKFDSVFLEAVEERKSELETVNSGEIRQLISSRFEHDNVIETLCETAHEDLELAATYIELNDRIEVPITMEWIGLYPVFLYRHTRSEPATGIPNSFAPIPVEKMTSISRLFSPMVVYIWRENCDPCDQMRDTFNRIFPEPPADMAVFSVYGPENPTLLREEFDVGGAPTTLFVRETGVDARLTGAHYRRTIEKELSLLREYSTS